MRALLCLTCPLLLFLGEPQLLVGALPLLLLMLLLQAAHFRRYRRGGHQALLIILLSGGVFVQAPLLLKLLRSRAHLLLIIRTP